MYRRRFLLHPLFDPNTTGGSAAGAGDGGAAAASGTGGAAGDGGSTAQPIISPEDLKALQEELKRLKDAETARQQASLTEQQKIEQRATDAETALTQAQQELRNTRAERAIERAASKLKLDGELASTLLKPGDLEFDEQGQPKDVEAKLQALVTKWPQLAVAQSSSTSPTNPPRGSEARPATLTDAIAARIAKQQGK